MIWVLSGLVIIALLINNLSLRIGILNLDYKLETEKDMAEIGEEVEVYSIIENNKPFVVSFIRVYERFRKGFNRKANIYSLFIMPYQRVKRTYKLFGLERGRFFIKSEQLNVGDFIGLKTEIYKLKQKKEIIILPKKIELKDEIIPIGSLIGDVSVKRWILDDPLMTIGIREYTGNEPERFIHWPSSLRYGELMVKNFDFTTDNSVMVILNVETMKPSFERVEGEIIEKSISIARTIMEEFEEAKIPYGFASNSYKYASDYNAGYFYQPGLGISHLNEFLRILGKMDYRVGTRFQNTIKNTIRVQANYSAVVIVTPRILEDYIEPINTLSKFASRTVVISVEDDYLENLNKNIIKYRGR